MTALWTIPILLSIGAVVLVMAIDYLFADLNDQGEPEECDQ